MTWRVSVQIVAPTSSTRGQARQSRRDALDRLELTGPTTARVPRDGDAGLAQPAQVQAGEGPVMLGEAVPSALLGRGRPCRAVGQAEDEGLPSGSFSMIARSRLRRPGWLCPGRCRTRPRDGVRHRRRLGRAPRHRPPRRPSRARRGLPGGGPPRLTSPLMPPRRPPSGLVTHCRPRALGATSRVSEGPQVRNLGRA